VIIIKGETNANVYIEI